MRSWLGLLIALSWGLGCGPRSGASSAKGAERLELPSPPRPWAELSFAEKKRYMGEHVLPVMEAEFKRYDATRYAAFSCDTCHGPDMVERAFMMPNPSLLALHPTGSPEQRQMVQDHPDMVKFMYNHVLPKMQSMLGAASYDVATKAGFSCYACHPSAGAAPAASAELKTQETAQ